MTALTLVFSARPQADLCLMIRSLVHLCVCGVCVGFPHSHLSAACHAEEEPGYEAPPTPDRNLKRGRQSQDQGGRISDPTCC